MITQLFSNLSSAPAETLEQIATEAAGLATKVSSQRVGNEYELEAVKKTLLDFSKAVTDRGGTIGYGCASRILAVPIPSCTHPRQMTFVWEWIERTGQNVSREIDRRERKQLFAVAVLAPALSAVISAVSILVAGAGILVNAFIRR
jgi:hypothetical protein